MKRRSYNVGRSEAGYTFPRSTIFSASAAIDAILFQE
jgi:hypothetical protein